MTYNNYKELPATLTNCWEANIYRDGVRLNFGDKLSVDDPSFYHFSIYISKEMFGSFADLIDQVTAKFNEPKGV